MSGSNNANAKTSGGSGGSSINLDEIEAEIKSLRVNYEKYFRGEEPREPAQQRQLLKTQVRRMVGDMGHNTARKFRAQTLQQTLLTHEHHWDRVCREIEEGTYKIHKLRAKKLIEQDAAEEAATVNEMGGAAKAGTPGAKKPAEYSEAVRAIHTEYEQALATAGLSTRVPIEKLAATLEQQAMLLRQRYDCRNVEFRVELKDGKPIIKAFPS